jgi:hypothetical protein
LTEIDLVHGVQPESTEWRDEMSALRDVVDRCKHPANPAAVAPVARHLDFVERWRSGDPSGAE